MADHTNWDSCTAQKPSTESFFHTSNQTRNRRPPKSYGHFLQFRFYRKVTLSSSSFVNPIGPYWAIFRNDLPPIFAEFCNAQRGKMYYVFLGNFTRQTHDFTPAKHRVHNIVCVYIYIHKHIQYTHTMYTRDRYMYVYVYYIQIFIYGGSQVYFFPQPLLEIMKNSTKGRVRIFFGKQHAIGPARPPAQSRKISLELEAVFCRSTGCKT